MRVGSVKIAIIGHYKFSYEIILHNGIAVHYIMADNDTVHGSISISIKVE